MAGAAAAAGAGLLAAPAAAALPVPAPRGDDVGFLSFGAVAELTSLDRYRRAGAVRAFSPPEAGATLDRLVTTPSFPSS